MNFIEAISLINEDNSKKLSRSSWRNYKYVFIDDDINWISISTDGLNSITLTYSPPIEDILATDWEIYQKAKLHTFEEALIALKEGRSIKRLSGITEFSFCKLSGRIIEVYHKEQCNSPILFVDSEVLANDWIII